MNPTGLNISEKESQIQKSDIPTRNPTATIPAPPSVDPEDLTIKN